MRARNSTSLFYIINAHTKCFPHLLPTWLQEHTGSHLEVVHGVKSMLELEIHIH